MPIQLKGVPAEEPPRPTRKRRAPTQLQKLAKRLAVTARPIPVHRPTWEARPRTPTRASSIRGYLNVPRWQRELERRFPGMQPIVADAATQTAFGINIRLEPIESRSDRYIWIHYPPPPPPDRISNTIRTAIIISDDERPATPEPGTLVIDEEPAQGEGEE